MTDITKHRRQIRCQTNRCHRRCRLKHQIKDFLLWLDHCHHRNSKQPEDKCHKCDRHPYSYNFECNFSPITFRIFVSSQDRIAVSKRTATVVVLIPPAVPAGEPPMIISMQASSFEPFVRPDWDILAIPLSSSSQTGKKPPGISLQRSMFPSLPDYDAPTDRILLFPK